MAYVIPYKGCKIQVSESLWEGGKEFASYSVSGTTSVMKTALSRRPIKGKVPAAKALETAKRLVDDLISKGK